MTRKFSPEFLRAVMGDMFIRRQNPGKYHIDEYTTGIADGTDGLGEQWYMVFTFDGALYQAPFVRATSYYYDRTGEEWDEPFWGDHDIECQQVTQVAHTTYTYSPVVDQ